MNKGQKTLLLIILISLVGLGVVGFASLEYTSRPQFCSSCHEMKPMYESWANSSHLTVDCLECHAEPGFTGLIKTKMGALRQVAEHFKGVDPADIVAEVPSERCTSCHEIEKIKPDNPKFSHQLHLTVNFDCMDCHSRVVHGPEEKKIPDPSRPECAKCHKK
ncbi:cytochrome c3 family protein [Calderihabitans maritimus]|uniref:Cytochrome c-type protein n=1 Tax=Calderihabitans maritimus TaxID=1246530 RepID=A0A1Z5HWF4_9FIRM|nr:NapC/NirT family cytochrome c [Calderihabitans maritimus]GAW93844.1 NapC/NirT family cytochrome c [Calderihabitans maritimus]